MMQGGRLIMSGAEDVEGYVPVYYPRTTDPAAAAPLELQPAVTLSGIDLTVSSIPTLRVRGRVFSAATGQPVRNAALMLLPRRAGFEDVRNANYRARAVNEQGEFEIRGVVPGSYSLVASTNDRNNRMSARVLLDVANSDIENIALILSPGFTITGQLAIEGRPGETVTAETNRMRVMLRPETGPMPMGGGGQLAARLQQNGTFALQQVGQGDYRLVVDGMPRNHYLKAARLGSADVLNEGLRIDDPPSSQLEIVIGADAGTLDGTVLDQRQQPAINVAVVLIPEPPLRHRNDLYRTVSSDANGRFHAEGIPPGTYKAFAWEVVDPGAWQDPEFIRTYESLGKPFRISEGGPANLELKAIPPQM
jgi:hypothetical protein